VASRWYSRTGRDSACSRLQPDLSIRLHNVLTGMPGFLAHSATVSVSPSQKGKNMILAVAAALMLMTGTASAQVPMQSLRQLPEQLPTTPGEIYQGFASPNLSIVKKEIHRAYSKFCEEEWPNDYRMELYCQENQKIAAERLANLEVRIWERAGTTAGQVAERIFKFCRAEWPRDYSMSYYCIENQTEAYNRLQKRR
jgi:hypothetical protein